MVVEMDMKPLDGEDSEESLAAAVKRIQITYTHGGEAEKAGGRL